MTYNPSIPQSSDLISQSQAQVLTNFSQLNTIFDVDHVTYNDATSANRGKHDKSTYVEGSDPVTSTNEVAVYSKDTGTQPDLFYRPESSGTATRLTGGGITAAAWVVFNGTSSGPIAPAASYNIQGSITKNATGNYTLTFSRSFSSVNYCVVSGVDATNASNTLTVSVTTRNANNCTFKTIGGSAGTLVDCPMVSLIFFGTLA